MFVFQCLNSDGVPIRIDVSFQFKAIMKNMRDIVLDFKDFDGYKQVLTSSGGYVSSYLQESGLFSKTAIVIHILAECLHK